MSEFIVLYFIKYSENFYHLLYSTHLWQQTNNKKIYLIPEGETRDSHTYHYTVVKTKKFIQENEKLKIKKFNPVKRKHEWFVEAKLPPHSKN